jgi:tRNA threonylcarbamoyladenosine biosynthesis protein TsaB
MRGERYAQAIIVAADGRVSAEGAVALATVAQLAAFGAPIVGPLEEAPRQPHARGVARMLDVILGDGPVSLESWEPSYGRLAEAQVRWEAAHGRPLASG